MGLKAAVQALKKAEELKAKVVKHRDLLNNSEAWSDQQQLQTVYHQVLVLDLEYALDKKVEQELWTLGFKNHIAALQHLSRDKKNPRRSECQALLSWCLEAASGFYLTLLQELCTTFELDLPFRRRSAVYGQTKPWPNSEQLIQPHKTSCLYICQYCLVHLGDIARYRTQRKQAESFYRHAILLSPSSGQPYNQLALLEASRGDKLATVFHYVRSICVKYPFPAAATNLANTFSALIDNDVPIIEHHSKLTPNEFISLFLRVHGLLHSATDLNQAETYIKTLNATFTALVATQMFSSSKLIQMFAINLYALRHTTDTVPSHQFTKDELKVKHLILEMLAGALSAYLLPIYTMNDNSALLDYYALPAIKLTLDWIKTAPDMLNGAMFTKRLQLWPSLCKLLNNLQNNITDFNMNKYDKIPLPEDRDLQCFLPLSQVFKDLDFTSDNLNCDMLFYNKLRILRLVSLGNWLCTQHINNVIFMTSRNQSNTNNVYFEPEKKQPDPTTELLQELKFFSMQDNTKSVNVDVNQSLKPSPKGTEKRSGILKPQGSLEKSREEREQALLLSSSENENSSCNTSQSSSSLSSTRSDILKSKRTRQNVAMQALVKKVEENKQVTFQTEPLIKTIDHVQQKNIETKTLDITQEAAKPNNLLSSSNSSFQMPPVTISNEIKPNQNFQNTSNSVQMNYNQNVNYPRVNVGNMPFPIQYTNNSQNILYHNNIPQQNNLHFSRQPPINMPPNNSAQNVTYQNTNTKGAIHDPFSSWMLDDKLPLPPATWWSTNQKPPPHRTYPPNQHDNFKQNYPYNINSVGSQINYTHDNLKPLNMDYNVHYNSNMENASGLNNISAWNNAPNMQSSLQLLFGQPGVSFQSAQTNQSSVDSDVNKMQNTGREANIQSQRECSENQTNSMPGYSLFNSNWAPNLVHSALQSSQHERPLIRQQSLFSGPGPSPLERLLEQQKQLRGTNKDDT